mgnify:CR=1 FL=1
MDILKTFKILIQGLTIGVHQFEFEVKRSFFDSFENSAIKDGNIDVKLHFDKRYSMFVLDFEVEGTVKEECDRCSEEIDLQINGEQQFIIKFSEEEREEIDDVSYINPLASELNVAKYISEVVHLNVPIRKVKSECDEIPSNCEFDILSELNKNIATNDEEAEKPTSIWDELNKLKQ